MPLILADAARVAARAILMLLDGATVHAVVRGDVNPVRQARDSVSALLTHHLDQGGAA